MHRKKDLQHLGQLDLRIVEHHPHHLVVAGVAAAHGLIARVVRKAVAVAGLN
jgi:hypothetical protein